MRIRRIRRSNDLGVGEPVALGLEQELTELGVQGFSSTGASLGLLVLPQAATGLTFGSADLRTLYVTTANTLYSFAMPVPGVNR